jgi:pimeloyl-ACP methyl ester carboxylesterase
MADQQKPTEIAGWIDGPASRPHDPDETDPKLLRDHSEIRSFKTKRYTYPGVRVFYRRHPQADQLPQPSLPLLVFVHGLGGSIAQFHPLMTSLVHLSSTLAIDLPGCGRSELNPTDWDAYSYDALIELLDVIIEDYRKRDVEGTVVLIGQSMGSNLCARLASRTKPGRARISEHVVGYVGICPLSGPVPEEKAVWMRRLLYVPEWIFNLWRAWDQWGGPYSASVTRFAGTDGDLHFRKMQDRFNKQSRSPTFRRMAWGAVNKNADGTGGLQGEAMYAGIEVPVYLVGGEADDITPPGNIAKIEGYLAGAATSSPAAPSEDDFEIIGADAAPVNPSTEPSDHMPTRIDDIREEDFSRDKRVLNRDESSLDDPSTPQESLATVPPQLRHPSKVVKSIVLPAPANHALIYQGCNVRILAGLISEFLQDHVTNRLSLGWQLQYLSREGKWDVKNLEKWRKVAAVSAPIGPPGAPVFRAMKTLREADEAHSPAVFVKQWGGIIKDVIDISHDQPVYDALTMEQAGIKYHKFATVSKIPPRDGEVETFIRLVDHMREQRKADEGENVEDPTLPDTSKRVIGVHCHYGFNRTGYFLVCYLVERCGFSVQEAIDTFATARPNGIRHSHFLDQLFVRYSGLKKEDAPAC